MYRGGKSREIRVYLIKEPIPAFSDARFCIENEKAKHTSSIREK